MTSNNNPSNPRYAALIGLDWGDSQHAIALHSAESLEVETRTLEHSPENVHAWLQELQERFGGQPVAVALETSKGPLIHRFCEVPWLTVYPIHPATSAHIRKAFKPSGAKDDTPDAMVLLDLLLNKLHELRPLAWQDPATRNLARRCELRRGSVDQRTQVTNRMTTLLKSYFPQALELVGDNLYSPMALDFLMKWPDLITLKASRPSTLRKFYYDHNVRSQSLLDERLELVARAQALTTDEVIVQCAREELARLIDLVAVLQKHIRQDEKLIREAFAAHPEAELFRDLPGAGPAMAPRLLVAFGTDRSLYPTCESFQRYSGTAPVTEKSGNRIWVHWRWNASKFLRQTMIEWAGLTVKYCDWAKAYYRQQQQRGKNRWTILRSLAFIWIRILWKCWQTRTPYNEKQYVDNLRRRGSTLVQPA